MSYVINYLMSIKLGNKLHLHKHNKQIILSILKFIAQNNKKSIGRLNYLYYLLKLLKYNVDTLFVKILFARLDAKHCTKAIHFISLILLHFCSLRTGSQKKDDKYWPKEERAIIGKGKKGYFGGWRRPLSLLQYDKKPIRSNGTLKSLQFCGNGCRVSCPTTCSKIFFLNISCDYSKNRVLASA